MIVGLPILVGFGLKGLPIIFGISFFGRVKLMSSFVQNQLKHRIFIPDSVKLHCLKLA